VKLKVYQANSMADAMSQVKKDLGKDAVILHTRSFKVGTFFGFGGRTRVEVTASNDPAVLQPEFLRKRVGSAAVTGPSASSPKPLSKASSTPVESAAAKSAVSYIAAAYGVPAVPARAKQAEQDLPQQPTPAARAGPHVEAKPAAPVAGFQQQASSHLDLAHQVDELREIVGHLAHVSAGAPLPPSLQDAHSRLVRADIDPRLVGQIIWSIRDTLAGSEQASDQVINHALVRRLEKLLPKAADLTPPSRASTDRPFTIALIGPTGVGKTTTVAKLAADFKLRHGLRVGLITADTYRIAAVEQLRTYASIIGLPLKVALTQADIEQALLELSDCRVILIDTAGRSPGDESKLAELQSYLTAAKPHQIHLLLSGVLGKRSLQRAAQAYGKLNPDHILLTKLDEAASLGAMLELTHHLPAAKLSYFTTGQEVPDDIEPGCPRRLARCIIAGELDVASGSSHSTQSTGATR
jgi:flagellar biosynthesis protein FlhF